MIESMLKHVYMIKMGLKYEILKNLEFHEKEPKTSGFIDFSTSNIQISHADACVRCCAGLSLTWCEALSVMMCLRAAEGQNPALSAQK